MPVMDLVCQVKVKANRDKQGQEKKMLNIRTILLKILWISFKTIQGEEWNSDICWKFFRIHTQI